MVYNIASGALMRQARSMSAPLAMLIESDALIISRIDRILILGMECINLKID